jgi:hypothetical protein
MQPLANGLDLWWSDSVYIGASKYDFGSGQNNIVGYQASGSNSNNIIQIGSESTFKTGFVNIVNWNFTSDKD